MKYLVKREDGFYRLRGTCIPLVDTVFIKPDNYMCCNITTGCTYCMVFISSNRQSVFRIKQEF